MPLKTCARAAAAVCITVALTLPAGARAAEESPPFRFAEWLPARTVVFVEAPDLGAARVALEGADLGGIVRAFGPFASEIVGGLEERAGGFLGEIEHETGVDARTLLRALSGGLAFAVVDIRPEAADDEAVDLAAAIDAKGRLADVAALLAGVKGRAPPLPEGEEATYALDGVHVEAFGARPTVHAGWIGERLVLATSRALLTEIVAAARGRPGGETLARSAGYVTARGRVVRGTPVVFAYASTTASERVLDRLWARDAAIAKAFGVDTVTGHALAIGIEGKAVSVSYALLGAGARRGIPGLVAADGAADLGLARVAPADAASFAAVRVDLGATAARVREMYRAVGGDEVAAEIDAVLGKAAATLGADRIEDVLGPLGSDFALVSFVPEGGGLFTESVIVARPRDAREVAARILATAAHLGIETRTVTIDGESTAASPRAPRWAITCLAAPLGRLGEPPWFAGPKLEDFEDRHKHLGEGPERIRERRERAEMEQERLGVATFLPMFVGAYMVHDGHLLIADHPQAIAEMLDRAGRGNLADSAAFKAEVARVPAGAALVAYEDPRATLPTYLHLLVKVIHAVEPAARAAGVGIDSSLLPRARDVVPHLRPGIASVVGDGEGITVTMRTSLGVPPALPGPVAILMTGGFAAYLRYEAARDEARFRAMEEIRALKEARRAMEEEERKRREEEERDERNRKEDR